MKRAYWVYGFLLGYLSMQGHEVLHWITILLFGFKGTVSIYSYSLNINGAPWQFAVISLAGSASTIIYEIIGLILFNMKNIFIKRTGFILIVINSIGRILYEFSGLIIGVSGDEVNAAQWLHIDSIYLRAPITLFCAIVLIYVLWKDTQTGFRSIGWMMIFFSSFIAVIATVLSAGSITEKLMQNGNLFVRTSILGYLIYLFVINAIMISGLIYLIIQRRRFLEVNRGKS